MNKIQDLITNLIITGSTNPNLGVLQGKAGSSLLFALLYENSHEELYNTIASRLIDEIFEEVAFNTGEDFENGLAGIGWTVEFLAQRKYLIADTDYVLNVIDRRLHEVLNHVSFDISLRNGYCGFALYLLIRLRNRTIRDRDSASLRLTTMLENTIDKIYNELNQDEFRFNEPSEFNVCWEPILILLLASELEKSEFSSVFAKIDSSELKSAVLNKTSDNYIFRDILLQLSKDDSDSIFDEGTINEYINLLHNSTSESNKSREIIYSFLVVLALMGCPMSYVREYIFKSKLNESLFRDIDTYSETHNVLDFNLLEGIGGQLLLYSLCLNSKQRTTHRQIQKSDVHRQQVFFFPYRYSGAGTYSGEMISFLSSKKDIDLYIVEISPTLKWFKIDNDEDCCIKIPIQENRHNGYRFTSISSSEKTNFFHRVVSLLHEYICISDSAIFHFNHPIDYVELYPLIKKQLRSTILLTWHFVIEPLIKQYYIDAEKEEFDLKELPIFSKSFDHLPIDGIICVSNFAKLILSKYYNIPDKKIDVIWNGTSNWKHVKVSNENKRIIKKNFGINPNDKIIVFAGKLEARKGIAEFISTAKLIIKEFSDVHIIVAGSGNYNEYLPSCFEHFGKISFTGNITLNQLSLIYQIADLGIVPSRWELFGYVAIEMMHSGLAVIATEVPGMNEIFMQYSTKPELAKVVFSENEFFVDIDSLFRIVKAYLNDNSKINQQAKEGLLCAKNIFSREHMGCKTVNFYNKMERSHMVKNHKSEIKILNGH